MAAFRVLRQGVRVARFAAESTVLFIGVATAASRVNQATVDPEEEGEEKGGPFFHSHSARLGTMVGICLVATTSRSKPWHTGMSFYRCGEPDVPVETIPNNVLFIRQSLLRPHTAEG